MLHNQLNKAIKDEKCDDVTQLLCIFARAFNASSVHALDVFQGGKLTRVRALAFGQKPGLRCALRVKRILRLTDTNLIASMKKFSRHFFLFFSGPPCTFCEETSLQLSYLCLFHSSIISQFSKPFPISPYTDPVPRQPTNFLRSHIRLLPHNGSSSWFSSRQQHVVCWHYHPSQCRHFLVHVHN